jgi:hypothetical protein
LIVYEPTPDDRPLPEARTKSGIILPSFSALYGELRSWVKVRGEPSQVLYCTADAFVEVWQEFKRRKDQTACIAACDHLYGLPAYYFWNIIDELVYVGVTYQPKERAKPAPGGIWYDDWTGPKAGVWIQK